MSDMLILFTLISVLLIIVVPPISMAKSIDILSRTKSKLCYIPIVNEIRAEIIFSGKIGMITISWIALAIFLAGSYITAYSAFDSVIYLIFHYGFFFVLLFWYVAKAVFIFTVNSQLRIQPTAFVVVQSIIYPWGYAMLKSIANLFRSMHKEG